MLLLSIIPGTFPAIVGMGSGKEGMGWEKLPLVLEEDGEIKASLLILKGNYPYLV